METVCVMARISSTIWTSSVVSSVVAGRNGNVYPPSTKTGCRISECADPRLDAEFPNEQPRLLRIEKRNTSTSTVSIALWFLSNSNSDFRTIICVLCLVSICLVSLKQPQYKRCVCLLRKYGDAKYGDALKQGFKDKLHSAQCNRRYTYTHHKSHHKSHLTSQQTNILHILHILHILQGFVD